MDSDKRKRGGNDGTEAKQKNLNETFGKAENGEFAYNKPKTVFPPADVKKRHLTELILQL